MDMTNEELDKGLTVKEKEFLARVRELTNADRNGYKFYINRRIIGAINFLPHAGAGAVRFPDNDKFRDPEVIAQAVEMYRQGAFTARRDAIAEQQVKLRELCGLPAETNNDD